MQIAIVTFDGFNELDSLIAFSMLHRAGRRDWRVSLCGPTPTLTSMNGLVVQATSSLEDASTADAVVIGSGSRTREVVADASLMGRLVLDPTRQLVGAQCSGTLVLAHLGLIGDMPACTDSTTKPWVVQAGVRVVERPFVSHGNVATAGGCLASTYLAAWVIGKLADLQTAEAVVRYVAPVGEKDETVARVMRRVALPAAEAM